MMVKNLNINILGCVTVCLCPFAIDLQLSSCHVPISHLIAALFSELFLLSSSHTPNFSHYCFVPFFRPLPWNPSSCIYTFYCIPLSFHSPEQTEHSPVAEGWILVSFQPGHLFSSLGKILLSVQQGMQSPCPVHHQVLSFAEVFLGSSWLWFYQGRALPSALALGSLTLVQSFQTLFLRSFSWLFILFHTLCCPALLSSTCSVCQLVLHHLQLSSLSSSVSFSHMGVCSCNHFHPFSCDLRCLRKLTKLTVYYLKLLKLNNAGNAKLHEHLYSDFCCLVLPFIFPAFFPFIPLFPEINPEYKLWPPFFYKLCTDLTQCLFSNPWQASGRASFWKQFIWFWKKPK